ncbi:OmpA family protein [Mucilaginibacter sp. Bleaf8]|uniref:OmpA family protein n=1 Tax=Mucilaginibacter sp. Bleaf8 TaxID=2834430 RepID=UPI001BCF07C2|nr:OmpA family protein [Mucilaginibacter sp. Bleaf8]MBS7565264.1 OmpA family protein [Mucilaginibacter sp. Bleaf8]
MAELDVKPKSRTPWWLWLLLLLIVLGVLFYFLRMRNDSAKQVSTTTVVDSTTTVDSSSTAQVATTTASFDNVDFNSPTTRYDEISDTTITVQGGDKYAIYSLGGNVLFAKGQSTLQGTAAEHLKQVAASLQKRFSNAVIGVYGHTDASGDAAQNKELGAKRAQAVCDWLVSNGNLSADRIAVRSYGESEPLASNATNKGQQLNRSVEIVAIPDSLAH